MKLDIPLKNDDEDRRLDNAAAGEIYEIVSSEIIKIAFCQNTPLINNFEILDKFYW